MADGWEDLERDGDEADQRRAERPAGQHQRAVGTVLPREHPVEVPVVPVEAGVDRVGAPLHAGPPFDAERLVPCDSVDRRLEARISSRISISRRQALWHLRRAFAMAGAGSRDMFEIDLDRLGLRRDLECDLDVVRFRSLLGARPLDLHGALGLYRGEYAEGLDLECFARDRELPADLYEDALAQLADRCLRDGDLACARVASLDLIARDPLREEAHATLIEVFGRTGSRDQVVRQYRRLLRLLDCELGIEPLAETQESFRTAMRQAGLRSARAVARRASRPGPQGDPALHEAPTDHALGQWPRQ